LNPESRYEKMAEAVKKITNIKIVLVWRRRNSSEKSLRTRSSC